MADDDDYTTLTIQQRLASPKWKARVHAYEELFKKFSEAEEDSAPVFREHASVIKTIMEDKNVIAQEKGMPTLVIWVDRSSIAPRNTPAICKKLISKCLCARPKTQTLTKEAILLFIERDQADAVLKCLFEGSANKTPKIAAASINLIQEALEIFGAKVVSAKTILNQLPKLFEFNDNKAREATMAVAKQLYKFVGPEPLKAVLSDIRSAQMKELEDYFASEPFGDIQPSRLTRSAVKKAQEAKYTEQEEEEPMDAFSLIDAVDIMSKLTPEFFEQIESKKWKERQEQVNFLASVVDAPKLKISSELLPLFRILKQIIAKDVNIMVATKAIECVGFLANGLRKDFAKPARIFTAPMLERLKEKKPFVLAATHNTLDAMYQNCVNLSDILDDVCSAFTTHKVVNVRIETLKFLLRCLKEPPKRLRGRCPIGKEDVKVIARACITSIGDTSGDVRDLAAEVLGVLTGIVGERVTQPYLAKLDGVRLKKVKSFIPEVTEPMPLQPEPVTVNIDSIKPKPKPKTTAKPPSTTQTTAEKTPKKPTARTSARAVESSVKHSATPPKPASAAPKANTSTNSNRPSVTQAQASSATRLSTKNPSTPKPAKVPAKPTTTTPAKIATPKVIQPIVKPSSTPAKPKPVPQEPVAIVTEEKPLAKEQNTEKSKPPSPAPTPATAPVSSEDDSHDFISSETFAEWCKILEGQKAARCIRVMKLICMHVEQDSIPISHADVLAERLGELTKTVFATDPINIRLCKYILRTWQVIFAKKIFVNSISIKLLKSIVRQILLDLQHEQLTRMGDDGKQIIQALYNAILLILNNYDRSDVIVMFLELLTSSIVQNEPENYIDCLVKCLLKLAKTLGATIHLLDLEKILLGFNEFFLTTPKNDEELNCKPHRMIKTILNEIVRLKGPQLQSALDKAFPNDQDSAPVCAYAQQFLALQKQNLKQQPTPVVACNSPASSLNAGDKQKLLEIFKKVRSKDTEETNSALMELYEFQKQNPTINFAPFLERTSKTFRDFITTSLVAIRKEEEKLSAEQKQKEEKPSTKSEVAQPPKESLNGSNKEKLPTPTTKKQELQKPTENSPPNTIETKSKAQKKPSLVPPPKRILNTSDVVPASSNDLAESYMEKLTRLRAKYKSRDTNIKNPSSVASTTLNKPTASVATVENQSNDMPKPNLSLSELKQQLQDVKAMSPQKKAPKVQYSPCSSPASPAPTTTALSDLKNQLSMLKAKR